MRVVIAMKRFWTRSSILIVALVAVGGGLAAWKVAAIANSAAAAASQPEPMESIVVAALYQLMKTGGCEGAVAHARDDRGRHRRRAALGDAAQ